MYIIADTHGAYSLTRRNTDVWLVGQPVPAIPSRKLPSVQDVLQRFFYLTRLENNTMKAAASVFVHEVIEFWQQAGIPTTADYNVITRVIFRDDYN